MRPVIAFSPGIPQTTQSLHRQTFIRPLELVLRSHRSCEGLKILFVDSITEDLEWHETCMSDVANQFLIDGLEAGSLQLDICMSKLHDSLFSHELTASWCRDKKEMSFYFISTTYFLLIFPKSIHINNIHILHCHPPSFPLFFKSRGTLIFL